MNHTFDRSAILDWYDGEVQAVVHCRHCNEWFFLWLLAWDPDCEPRTYAIRSVQKAWCDRVRSVLDERPSSELEQAAQRSTLTALKAELFSEPSTEVLVAETTRTLRNETISFQPVDPNVLGYWGTPRDIEEVVDQSAQERLRLQQLAKRPLT